MKLSKKATRKVCKGVAEMAMGLGKASVNSNCELWFYQPRVPKAMDQFKNKNLK